MQVAKTGVINKKTDFKKHFQNFKKKFKLIIEHSKVDNNFNWSSA